MPFIYNPNEASAIGQIGQTLRSMQNRDASLALRAAIAQQQQMRMAQRDAMQSGLWEAQSQQALSQAALDDAKRAIEDAKLTGANLFGQHMRTAGTNAALSPETLEVVSRLAALGQNHLPVNAAQVNVLNDPRLAALMATGARPTQAIAPGYTQVAPETGKMGATAPGQPFNQLSTMPSAYGAAVRAMDLYLDPITKDPPPVGSDNYEAYQQTKALMEALAQRLQGLVQPGAPAPQVPPPGAQVAPPQIDLPPGVLESFTNRLYNAQGQLGTNSIPTPAPAPPPTARPQPQGAPTKKPKFTVDPVTRQLVPVK